MNDMANLCEMIGADINMVRKGIGADSRIGRSFLYPGCGYGGSCFPKDVKALIRTARTHRYPMRILQAVEDVNEEQKTILFRKLRNVYGDDLNGKRIALWGLAFKPETDDMREAPALVLIEALLKAGCRVTVYDPVAIPEARRRMGDSIRYAKDIYEAVDGAEALLIVTEWKEFRLPSWTDVKQRMKKPLILDGRNIYDPKELAEAGFTYHCVGR
jgi:UDPglucose 6-dehydrogenase